MGKIFWYMDVVFSAARSELKNWVTGDSMEPRDGALGLTPFSMNRNLSDEI